MMPTRIDRLAGEAEQARAVIVGPAGNRSGYLMLQPGTIHLEVQAAEGRRQILFVGHLQIDAAGQHSPRLTLVWTM